MSYESEVIKIYNIMKKNRTKLMYILYAPFNAPCKRYTMRHDFCTLIYIYILA